MSGRSKVSRVRREDQPCSSRSTRLNLILSTVFIVAMGACGNLGGCGACSAAQPLPGGALPADQTVEGGAQIRVTPPGFNKLTSILPGALNQSLGERHLHSGDDRQRRRVRRLARERDLLRTELRHRLHERLQGRRQHQQRCQPSGHQPADAAHQPVDGDQHADPPHLQGGRLRRSAAATSGSARTTSTAASTSRSASSPPTASSTSTSRTSTASAST